MNREHAKELLPIIRAFAEGKSIEFKDSYGKWIKSDLLAFDLPLKNYRIKPKPKYRPFVNVEECWQEMQKHNPFGWIKYKTDNVYSFIVKVDKDYVYLAVNEYWSFDTLLKKYTFADGTPFGIKEE